MKDYREQVALAYAQLVAEGYPLHSTPNEEQEKARLTRRAAYLIYQADRNIGLLSKTSGNNIMGLSVDIIIDGTNGEFADIASSRSLGDGQVEIIPVWVPNRDTGLIARWVQPTADLADIKPTGEVEIPGEVEVPDELKSEIILAALDRIDKKLDRVISAQEGLVDVAIKFVNKFK